MKPIVSALGFSVWLLGLLVAGNSSSAGINLTAVDEGAGDVVTLDLHVVYADTCWNLSGLSFSETEDSFSFVVSSLDTWTPEVVCADIVTDLFFQETVGPLAPGFYTAHATEFRTSVRDPATQYSTIPLKIPFCAPAAGSVAGFTMSRRGQRMDFAWENTSQADEYVLLGDSAPDGNFDMVEGTALDGQSGLSRQVSPDSRYYLVVATNPCGEGPRN